MAWRGHSPLPGFTPPITETSKLGFVEQTRIQKHVVVVAVIAGTSTRREVNGSLEANKASVGRI